MTPCPGVRRRRALAPQSPRAAPHAGEAAAARASALPAMAVRAAAGAAGALWFGGAGQLRWRRAPSRAVAVLRSLPALLPAWLQA
jgi:hypothetical protein